MVFGHQTGKGGVRRLSGKVRFKRGEAFRHLGTGSDGNPQTFHRAVRRLFEDRRDHHDGNHEVFAGAELQESAARILSADRDIKAEHHFIALSRRFPVAEDELRNRYFPFPGNRSEHHGCIQRNQSRHPIRRR